MGAGQRAMAAGDRPGWAGLGLDFFILFYFVFVCFCFFFLETGFLCVVLAVLELGAHSISQVGFEISPVSAA